MYFRKIRLSPHYQSIFWLVSKFPVVFQNRTEYIVAIFRGKFDCIQFLVFLDCEHKLVGNLQCVVGMIIEFNLIRLQLIALTFVVFEGAAATISE